jgi:hypothetical protein
LGCQTPFPSAVRGSVEQKQPSKFFAACLNELANVRRWSVRGQPFPIGVGAYGSACFAQAEKGDVLVAEEIGRSTSYSAFLFCACQGQEQGEAERSAAFRQEEAQAGRRGGIQRLSRERRQGSRAFGVAAALHSAHGRR